MTEPDRTAPPGGGPAADLAEPVHAPPISADQPTTTAHPTADRPTTGDPAVDAAVAPLSQLDSRPVEEHVAVYDGVHESLQDTLTALDEG